MAIVFVKNVDQMRAFEKRLSENAGISPDNEQQHITMVTQLKGHDII